MAEGQDRRLVQLDGLRSFAVLCVILVHHDLFTNGVYGVDIFFVLSGYLITSILRKEREEEVYWTPFYIKRFTRILPPVVILITAVALWGHHFYFAYFGYLLFLSNILQLTRFALPIIGPLWSLSVEEHFYLAWPYAIRTFSLERLQTFCVVILVLSPVARGMTTILMHARVGINHGWNNPCYLFTPLRLDGLAAGALLASLLENGRVPQFLMRWSGYFTLSCAALFFGLESMFKAFRRGADSLQFNAFGYSLVTALAFFIVAFLIVKPASRLSRTLSSPIPVFFGSVSYGIYLYQGIVAEITHHYIPILEDHRFVAFIVDLIVVTFVAAVSFYWIERPLIQLAKQQAVRRKMPKIDKLTPTSF